MGRKKAPIRFVYIFLNDDWGLSPVAVTEGRFATGIKIPISGVEFLQ